MSSENQIDEQDIDRLGLIAGIVADIWIGESIRSGVRKPSARESECGASGSPLSRPKKDENLQALLCMQTLEENRVCDEIEGKFDQGKRRFGLGQVKSKVISIK